MNNINRSFVNKNLVSEKNKNLVSEKKILWTADKNLRSPELYNLRPEDIDGKWEKIFRDTLANNATTNATTNAATPATTSDNFSVTENGALGYRTTAPTTKTTTATTKPHEPYNCPYAKFPVHTTPVHDPISDSAKAALVDFAFKVTSMRDFTPEQIEEEWGKVLDAGLPIETIVRFVFYVRNPRGGLGERRLARIMLLTIAKRNPALFKKLLPLIVEYGRWDDVWLSVFNTPTPTSIGNLESARLAALSYIEAQLVDDSMAVESDPTSVSLLAKWLPSINSHNKLTASYAKIIVNYLHWTPQTYRKLLSKLRATLNIVERKMSSNEWSEINYEHVPSLAAIKYRNAFLKKDSGRYKAYLQALLEGKKKINASVTSPVDIVHAYKCNSYYAPDVSIELESAWKKIPGDALTNTIVVRDGSGSMMTPINGSGSRTALDVSTALAVFFSERLNGPFKNHFITFSSRPRLVDLSEYTTLRDKLVHVYDYDDCSNTDLHSTFKLILDIAVQYKLKQEEIPDILVISDMEFDRATTSRDNERLFETIEREYAEKGYKLPRLIFNNVCSRSLTIPMIKNENGLILVSGFNQNISKMITTGCYDPFEAIMSAINDEAYELVDIFLYDLMSPGDYESEEAFDRRFELTNKSTDTTTKDASRASSRPRDSWGRDTKF